MSDGTKIEWTDATWNPITGCSRVSAGCENCYAERLAAGRLKHHPSRTGLTDEHGRWNGVVRLNQEWLFQPLRWKKPRRVFVVAHGDIFHERVPGAWIDMLFAVMASCPQHTFQVLTKRPLRARIYLGATGRLEDIYAVWHHVNGGPAEAAAWPLPNVWIGTSVENQVTANERIPLLLQTPAAVRWISAEPLLDAVTIWPFVYGSRTLDWVVVGGESGPGARPMDPAWARKLKLQCAASGTAFYMKQMAKKAPIPTELLLREYPEG